MWQIIELLPLLKNLNLDDNLVRIIAHLIYREENISQNVMVTVEPFTAFFRQDRHNHTAYLMYYNAIALKGHPSIAAHIVPYLFEALDKCFKDGISDIRATRGKVAVASIHLIFQNILAVFLPLLRFTVMIFLESWLISLQHVPWGSSPMQTILKKNMI